MCDVSDEAMSETFDLAQAVGDVHLSSFVGDVSESAAMDTFQTPARRAASITSTTSPLFES